MYIVYICTGLINVIYAGIVANVVRFIYIAYLTSPWWILPFECIQGKPLHHYCFSAMNNLSEIVKSADIKSNQIIYLDKQILKKR